MCFQAFAEMATVLFYRDIVQLHAASRAMHSKLHSPLWALAIALATGKNTRSFGVLDRNETQLFTYVSQRAEGEAATITTSD